MTRLAILTAAATLAALPLGAQDAPEDEGFSLMERGAQMFLEGILREMEPALNDLEGMAKEFEPALRGFMQEMGPAFAELLKDIEDFTAYHPPEILPNGDIIIRRKTPAEMADEPPDGDIEI